MQLTPHNPERYPLELPQEGEVYDLCLNLGEQELLKDAVRHYLSNTATPAPGTVMKDLAIIPDAVDDNKELTSKKKHRASNIFLVGLGDNRIQALALCVEQYGNHASSMAAIAHLENPDQTRGPEEFVSIADRSYDFAKTLVEQHAVLSHVLGFEVPDEVPADWRA